MGGQVQNTLSWYKANFWKVNSLLLLVALILAGIWQLANSANRISGTAATSGNNSIGSSTQENPEKKPEKKPYLARRKIDGVMVEKGKENLFPAAFMIENHVDSRPPSGLSKASIVYEAEAEGGITRFLAVYATDEKIEMIGPVRSARPYYIDWATEFDALYVHCGGSPDALSKIKKEGVFDLNEFYNGGYFWRDLSRYAPHNVYTSNDKIRQYLGDTGKNVPNYHPWLYSAEQKKPKSSSTISIINIYYKTPQFYVQYKYDLEPQKYLRNMGGGPHKDMDGTQISASNILVQYVWSYILDKDGRRSIKTYGQGNAVICSANRCQKGEWKYSTAFDRTIFYVDDKEVKLDPGTTWVEIVPNNYKVAFEDKEVSK